MLSLRKFAAFAAVAGGVAATGAAAHATTMTETETASYGPVGTNWTGSPADLSIPQFESSLGTLTSVKLEFTGTVNSSGSIKNTGTGSASISNVTASINIYLLPVGYSCASLGYTSNGVNTCYDSATAKTVNLYSLINMGGASLLLSSPVLENISNEQLAGGDSYTFNIDDVTDEVSETLSSDLTAYIGSGSLVFPLGTLAYLTNGYSGGNLSLTQTTVADADLTVIYTYTTDESAVPEPASLALLGLGLAGLGFVRSRKR